MAAFSRSRLFATLAALLLLVAMTAYAAHHHDAAGYTAAAGADHCDLCLQLHASAGPPPAVREVMAHAQPPYRLPGRPAADRPCTPWRHVLQPRAPPFLHAA